MDNLTEAQQIAAENDFELKQTLHDWWGAFHEIKADGQVFHVWLSHIGPDPLKVAKAAVGAKWEQIPLGPFRFESPKPLVVS